MSKMIYPAELNGSIDVTHLSKTNKTRARNLYNLGVDVYLMPCNVRLGNKWIEPHLMPKDDKFDSIVNAYEYYNCNSETGYYCSYYIK